MDAGFDPYYKWLGIPPEDQPADYYRLLGLRIFERDRDVIENAADQRMLLLRSRQSGPHVALCQKLLNEIAAARYCLLDDRQREIYNGKLRGDGNEQQISPPPQPSRWASESELREVPLPQSTPLPSSASSFSAPLPSAVDSAVADEKPVSEVAVPPVESQPTEISPPPKIPTLPPPQSGDPPQPPAEKITIDQHELHPDVVATVDAEIVDESRLVDEWNVQTPDGKYFGPVSKSELDDWVAKGRVAADFQILQVGSDQWHEASVVYTQLQPPVATKPPSQTAIQHRQQFACPRCASDEPPLVRTRISAVGWVVVVLLLACFPLNFLGLLITEEYHVCRRCGVFVK